MLDLNYALPDWAPPLDADDVLKSPPEKTASASEPEGEPFPPTLPPLER